MKIVYVIFAFAVLILYEVPRLVKKKYWRELIAFSVLMAIAFAVSVLQVQDIDFYNPTEKTQYIVKSLYPFDYD